MNQVSRFVVWICRKFRRSEIEKIIEELTTILKDPNSDVKPKGEFEEEHPNYRDFRPDANAPLSKSELPADHKKKSKKRGTTGKSSANTRKNTIKP